MLPRHTIVLEKEVLLHLFQHEPSLNLFVAFCMSATPTAFSRMWEAFIAEQLAIVFYTNREIASCCDCCVICDLKSVYSRCTDSRFWSDLLLISIKCLILVFWDYAFTSNTWVDGKKDLSRMALDEHEERMRVATCGCGNWQQPAAVWTNAGPTVDMSLLINHSFPFSLSHPNPKPSPLLTSTSTELPNPLCWERRVSLDMSSIISFININTHYLSHSSYLCGRCLCTLSL